MNDEGPAVLLAVVAGVLVVAFMLAAFHWKSNAESTDDRWSDWLLCMDTVEERELCSELFNPPEPANEFKTLTDRELLILEGK